MLSSDELIDLVRTYNPAADAGLLRAAHAFGAKAHQGQTRKSGEPYFTHPVSVAAILTEQRLDDASLATALLHDVLEDTGVSYPELSSAFGREIADLVNGVTKLTNMELGLSEGLKPPEAKRQAEDFRKLLLATSRDLRVLLVKLADRLHNMRTISSLPEAKRIRKARETLEIYGPLAGRMGMQWMRDELEDLAFATLQPDARRAILIRHAALREEMGDVIPRTIRDLSQLLENAGVEAEVFGREKRPFSIWRKMEDKELEFTRLSDIYGFRIVTGTIDDCYRALGQVHARWRAVPGRFKDYISEPKSNGYRSIHTTVLGRNARRVEIQIRTRQMHEVAETGVAAHWSYRAGERVENPYSVDPFTWLQELVEGVAGDDPETFLENVKLEMFSDKVFCFTPKGEVVKLPFGATPLDFAYAIHTRLGHSCQGALVDGQRVPLSQPLRNGQSVRILRAEAQRPQPGWLDMVVTGRAKSAIRRFLRAEVQEDEVRLGREIASRFLARVGKKATDKALETAGRHFNHGSAEEMAAALGRAEVTGAELLHALYPELMESTPEPADEGQVLRGLPAEAVPSLAPCCMPVPGERVVGLARRGEGVHVHAIDCEVLGLSEDARWIDLTWSGGPYKAQHRVSFEVTMANDAGVLGRVCTLVGEQNANISDIVFTERKPDFYKMVLEAEVRDLTHLHRVETAVAADQGVVDIRRLRGRTPQRLAAE